jgi:hypothetical protein
MQINIWSLKVYALILSYLIYRCHNSVTLLNFLSLASRRTVISKAMLTQLSNNDNTRLSVEELYKIALAMNVNPCQVLTSICKASSYLKPAMTQSQIIFTATGEIVSHIFSYSATCPVPAVCKKRFKSGIATT